MFKYKNFEIERDDEDNLSLYRTELVEEFVGGGRGKGRGTSTGKMVERRNWKGFYGTFRNAFQKVADTLLSESENVDDALKVLAELNKVGIPQI